jgi:predicted GNAT family acetyltransferase
MANPQPESPPAVVDDREHERFVLEVDGDEAELRYRAHGDRLVLVHTEVPEAFEGRGFGGMLVRAAVDRATRDGLTVVPLCSYAHAWLRKHPDVAGTVAIDWNVRPS